MKVMVQNAYLAFCLAAEVGDVAVNNLSDWSEMNGSGWRGSQNICVRR